MCLSFVHMVAEKVFHYPSKKITKQFTKLQWKKICIYQKFFTKLKYLWDFYSTCGPLFYIANFSDLSCVWFTVIPRL